MPKVKVSNVTVIFTVIILLIHIALAGPAMNIILAGVLFALSPLLSGMWYVIAVYGAKINSWLALFNMIPFGSFDGLKILRWSKGVYAGFLVISLLFVFVV